jgi:hypothetical protein
MGLATQSLMAHLSQAHALGSATKHCNLVSNGPGRALDQATKHVRRCRFRREPIVTAPVFSPLLPDDWEQQREQSWLSLSQFCHMTGPCPSWVIPAGYVTDWWYRYLACMPRLLSRERLCDGEIYYTAESRGEPSVRPGPWPQVLRESWRHAAGRAHQPDWLVGLPVPLIAPAGGEN